MTTRPPPHHRGRGTRRGRPRTRARLAGLAASFLVLAGSGGASLSPAPAAERAPYAADRPLPEATLFGEGVVSTPDDDLNSCFTPDGKTVYFSKRQALNLTVMLVSRFQGGRWGTPEIAPFSGQYRDADPSIAPDGSRLFYVSTRPLTPGGKPKDSDIWFVRRAADGWSEPVNLGPPVNTDKTESYPSAAADGTLYFSSGTRPDSRSSDIYRAAWKGGGYAEPERLGEAINTEYFDNDPHVSPDQSFIIFESQGRPDSLGGGDLYISYFRDGAWTTARNLGPRVNSKAREYCPILSPDGKYLFFTSYRGFADEPFSRRWASYEELVQNLRGVRNGQGNIYQIDIDAVHAAGGGGR